MDEGEAAGVPDFRDRDQVEAWLRTLPRDVAVLIAARAALRVLPLLVSGSSTPLYRSIEMLITAFRASASVLFSIDALDKGRDIRNMLENAATASALALADAKTSLLGADIDAECSLEAADNAVAAATKLSPEECLEKVFDAIEAAAAAGAFYGYDPRPHLSRDNEFGNRVVSIDAELSLPAFSAKLARQAPLWGESASPDWAGSLWKALCDSLDPADGWQVWIDWYEARLRGDPYDEELEECYVLIPEELWKQGPAVPNAEIARRIAAYRERQAAALVQTAREIDVEALICAPSLRIALADFAFDDLTRLMRLVPFPEDFNDFDDPKERVRLARELNALGHDAANLLEDSEPTRRQLPNDFRTDLSRYVAELSRGADAVLARRLWSLGAALRDWALDEDFTDGLNRQYRGKLDRLIEAHTELMKGFFARALASMRAVDRITLPEGAAPATLVAPLRTALDALDGEWVGAPAMTEEAKAVFAEQIDELDRTVKAIGRTRDAERVGELEQKADRQAKMAVSTILRFGLRSGQAALKGSDTAATFKELFPESFRAALEALRGVFDDFDWPF